MSNFEFKNSDGATVSVDLSNLKLTPEKDQIIKKILAQNGPAGLTRKEWEEIKDIKAGIKGVPGESDLIVRFDWTWVRIDERIRNFDELTQPGMQIKSP